MRTDDKYIAFMNEGHFLHSIKEEVDEKTCILDNGDIIYKTEHFPAVYKRNFGAKCYWKPCDFQEAINSAQEEIKYMQIYLEILNGMKEEFENKKTK